MGIFSKEPVLITALVGALLVLLVEFGVPVTDGQQTAIQTVIAAVLAIFARSQVVSPERLERAGTSVAEVMTTSRTEGVSLRPTADTVTAAAPNPNPYRPSAYGNGPIAILIALALGASTLIACGPRNANTSPQTMVAEYGTEILKVTASFQDVVIAYAKQAGGNATTDRIMATIEQDVTPRAKELSSLLKSYHTIASPELKETRAQQIEAQLQALVLAYANITRDVEAGKLASEAQVTSARIRELAAAVRLAIAQARAGSFERSNVTGNLAHAFE